MTADPSSRHGPAGGSPQRWAATDATHTRRVVVVVFLGWWTLFGLLYAARDRVWSGLQRGDDRLAWSEALLHGLVDAYLGAALAVAALWIAHRIELERRTWFGNLALHVAIGVAVIMLNVLLAHGTFAALSPYPERTLLLTFIGLFPAWCLIYTMLLGIGYGIQYFRRCRERELHSSQLESQLARARLQALNMQLHPHFLFNTLNSISALMHRDVGSAERMLSRLEDLLRLSIAHSGSHEVPLRRELEILEPYLEIEQTRFGERLAVEWAIAPDVLDAAVPQLILQPLVENAVKHGISQRSGPGIIRVCAQSRGDMLELEVTDNGPGFSPAPRSRTSGGFGLANTRARLQQLYPDTNDLAIEPSDDGGTSVRLRFPLRRAAAPRAA